MVHLHLLSIVCFMLTSVNRQLQAVVESQKIPRREIITVVVLRDSWAHDPRKLERLAA